MWRSAWALCVALALAVPAAALEPGDLLVGVDASLFVVDPDSGAVELLSPDPSFGPLPSTLTGVAATPGGGEIFIALAGPLAGGSVWRVDPGSGARSLIAELALGVNPGGIAIDAEGGLVVPHAVGVSRIDPRSGAESLLGATPPGQDPTGIAIEANGDLLVSSYQPFAGLSRVLRIHPGAPGFADLAGVRGGLFSGIALEADGGILVPIRPGGGTVPPINFSGLLRIDPESGGLQLVSSGGLIYAPTGLAVESRGEVVLLAGALSLPFVGAIVRIDPQGGSQTLVVVDPALQRASAIAVVRPDVTIDIRPSRVVLAGRRMLSVVLFGSEDLDVDQVDPASLAFGRGGAAPVRSLRVGRSSGGYADLVLLFRAAEADFQPGDTQACLSGSTSDFAFEACDAIRVRANQVPQPRRRRSSFWR